MHWNLRSANSNRNNLISLIRKYDPDVICLNETWLKSDQNFNINSYHIIRQDRDDGYGGVATCIKKNIIFTNIKNSDNNNIQYIITQISDINIINIYSNSNLNITNDVLEEIYSHINNKSILMGDLNSHHPIWDEVPMNRGGGILSDFVLNRDLVILNDGTPTMLQAPQNRNSAIDLVILSSDIAHNFTFTVLPDGGNSDHFPVMVKTKKDSDKFLTKYKTTPYRTRNFRKANWPLYYDRVMVEFSSNQGDMNYSNLKQIMDIAAKDSIPEKINNNTLRVGNPWWDEECTNFIKTRKYYLKQFKDHPTIENFILAKKYIAYSKKQLKKKKKTNFIQFCNNLNRNSNISHVWNKINKFNGKFQNKKHHNINDEMRSQILNNMKIVNIDPSFSLKTPVTNIEPFNIEELNYALKNKKSSAAGIDDISYEMIKHLPNQIKKALLNTYNSYLNGEQIPKEITHYNVIPILKPNKDPENTENYRPIILSSCFLKVLEILIRNRLDFLAESKQWFTPFQIGFRKGMGVNHNLALITSQINLAFERNETVMAVFIDIKSAYDCVNITKLYKKLNQLQVPIHITNLIFKILENRSLFTRKNDSSFIGPITTTSGLPQGSPLSTLLFNIYTLDLYQIPQIDITLIGYADDLVILCQGRDPHSLVRRINSSLDVIQSWLNKNDLRVSTAKSEAIWFTKGRRNTHPPPIVMDNIIIPFKNQTKHLGVILHKHLNWKYHIENVCTKAKKNTNILRAICRVWWGADPSTLLTIFYALIRSHLDYGSIFINPNNKTNINKLNTVHFAGIRTCLGCMRSTPTNVLLAEASEMNLDFRRTKLAVSFLSKVVPLANHPLTALIRKLWIFHTHNAGAWRNINTPYPLRAYEKLLPYMTKIYKSKTFPCYEQTYSNIFATIKNIDLNIKRRAVNASNQFLANVEKLKSYTFVFTDASKKDNRTGFGIHIPQINLNFSSRLPSEICISTAETIAIKEAILLAMRRNLNKIVIFSDSLSSINKITNIKIDPTSDYFSIAVRNLIIHERKTNNREILLAWIPGHSGIQGNETVDKLANVGRDLNVPLKAKIHMQDIRNIINKKVYEEFKNNWKLTTEKKGKSYSKIQKDFPGKKWFNSNTFIDRRHITTFIRMRSGHCLTGQHLFRIGVKTSPQCECGMLEDLNHLLFECPIAKIPNFDLYLELINVGYKPPFGVNLILSDTNPLAINLVIKYLDYNKIKL